MDTALFLFEPIIVGCLKLLVTVYSLLIAWVSVHSALALVLISGIYYKYISELTLHDDTTTTHYDYIIGMYICIVFLVVWYRLYLYIVCANGESNA